MWQGYACLLITSSQPCALYLWCSTRLWFIFSLFQFCSVGGMKICPLTHFFAPFSEMFVVCRLSCDARIILPIKQNWKTLKKSITIRHNAHGSCENMLSENKHIPVTLYCWDKQAATSERLLTTYYPSVRSTRKNLKPKVGRIDRTFTQSNDERTILAFNLALTMLTEPK